jgi:hypothetical protein
MRSPVGESTTKKTVVPTVPVTGRADLTDAERKVLEPLLPGARNHGAIDEWLHPYFLKHPDGH